MIGRVKSGGQGHSIRMSIAYTYVPIAHTEPGTKVEIEIFGEWINSTIIKNPLFDPTGEHIKA